MNKRNDRYIYKILLEGVVIFFLLAIGLIIETYQRGILIINQSLNTDLLQLIISKTFVITLVSILGYGIVKNIFYPFYQILIARVYELNNDKHISFFYDVFLITALILVSVSIRPVIQETFLESNIEGFEFFLVKHDALFSVITLIIIALPLIYLLHKKEKNNITKISELIVITLIISAVGIFNGLSNYSARISEARANWIKQDWQRQSENAKVSLENASTDKEKAVAYYWLGVAENRKRNHEKAKEYQLEAIELWPEYDAAHASLANAYINLGETDKSLEHSQKCIEISPDYAWCYQALMNYYLVTGDVENAKRNARKAVELNPENKELESIYKIISEY